MKKIKFTIEKKEGINEWSPYMEGTILCENADECNVTLAEICNTLNGEGDRELYYTYEEEEGGKQ